MRRNKELTEQVIKHVDLLRMKHTAIDKVTSVWLLLPKLSKAVNDLEQPVEDLEIENKFADLLFEANYYFHKYLKTKRDRYEKLLSEKEEWQAKTIEKGNAYIDKHIEDLQNLKEHREEYYGEG